MAKTLFNLDIGPTKGKTIGALAKSRGNYNSLIMFFGGHRLLPKSIMQVKRAKVTSEEDKVGATRRYSDQNELKRFAKRGQALKGSLKGMAQISGSGSRHGALSTFWQDVGRTCVLLYSKPGDLVVDPFAGHNSRMDLCVKAGRHYMGQDLSHEFMEFNRTRAAELRAKNADLRITLKEGDSRKLQFPSNVGDFTITSPPYWDIEEYGPEAEQMSNCKTYKEFIAEMQEVMNENFRCLKAGAFAAWFINDFRKEGVFYNYHGDIIKIGRRAGFIQHDIMIVDLGQSFGEVFVNQTVKQKILPKRHEYAIILKKPETEST